MPETSSATAEVAAIPAKRRRQPLASRRYTVEVRQQMAWQWQALILALALLLGLGLSAAILIAAGVPGGELFNEFVVLTLFDIASLKAVLFQAAPIVMVALAGCLAFRARFWNLGLEGQMIWGGIAATAISLFEIGPQATRLPLMMIAAALGGLAWALAPVLLKLKLKLNEIISTLMLNYIAANFLLHLVYGSWKDPRDAFPIRRSTAHSSGYRSSSTDTASPSRWPLSWRCWPGGSSVSAVPGCTCASSMPRRKWPRPMVCRWPR